MPVNLLNIVSSQEGASFLPVVIYLVIAITFVALLTVLTHVLGPSRKTKDKLMNFESGVEQIGNARQPMGVKYFLVAILFIVFDVEVIFFYPYAVNIKSLGQEGFFAILMFVAFFLCGFIYVIKKGALKWED